MTIGKMGSVSVLILDLSLFLDSTPQEIGAIDLAISVSLSVCTFLVKHPLLRIFLFSLNYFLGTMCTLSVQTLANVLDFRKSGASRANLDKKAKKG